MRSRPLLVSLVVCSAPAVVCAQPSDVDILLRRAGELRQNGQYEQALRLATQAAEREESPRTTGEIALCEVALERWVDAERHLAAALARANDPWVSRRRLTLDGALADVRQHLARVELVQGVAGARVEINGVAVGVLPIREPVRVASGNVEIVVRAEGYRDYRRAVQLYGGATHFEEVLMEPLRAASRAEPTATPRCGPGFVLRDGLCYVVPSADDGASRGSVAGRVLLWGGIAVTVIAGATAIGLGVDGERSAQDYLDRCGGTMFRATCEAEFATTQDFLDGRATVVNAMWAVAAVGVAASITGAVLEFGGRRRRAPRANVRVLPGALRVSW